MQHDKKGMGVDGAGLNAVGGYKCNGVGLAASAANGTRAQGARSVSVSVCVCVCVCRRTGWI